MQATPFPLDPLSGQEIVLAVELARAAGDASPDSVVITVVPHEPPKGAVRAYDGSAPLPREAIVTYVEPARAAATVRAVVSLTERRVLDLRTVEGGHAGFVLAEQVAAGEAVKRDPRIVAGLERRDLRAEDVEVGIFPGGNYVPEELATRRVVRTTCWYRGPGYPAHCGPVEGLIAVVDLDGPTVLEVIDNGAVPLPPPQPDRPGPGERAAELRPLEITQPEGPSFELDGHRIRWQGWELRLGFNAREGLTLHTVSFMGRSVLYRASFAEMVVPYGDPSPNHRDRAVFDFGEANIGLFANHLTLGCDCVGAIRYLDAVVNDSAGGVRTLPNAICLHEEDAGVLWKHTDMESGAREVRRSRRLVVSWFATLDNYDYGFFWHLYQDGRIECEVKLTGIVLVSALAPRTRPQHGELVAPGLNAMVHQHIFNVRLDMEVDGERNSVVELENEPLPPGAGNQAGNAFRARRTPLVSERQAERLVDPLRARQWKIVNPRRLNRLGEPVGYRLVPGDNAALALNPDSRAARRAGFARSHLWVTRFAGEELYAAGEFPNLHPGGGGLPAYVAADRRVEDEDIVVWYTFVHHHLPRPEDWPVMPVARIGFELKPSGFFDRNPALDLPDPHHCESGSTAV